MPPDDARACAFLDGRDVVAFDGAADVLGRCFVLRATVTS